MTDTPPSLQTEHHDPRYETIELWPTATILDSLAEAQMAATALVRAAVPALEVYPLREPFQPLTSVCQAMPSIAD